MQGQLRDVHQIQASYLAFAAVLGDGSVVAWGDYSSGGDSRDVQDQLKAVQWIHASCFSFAAVQDDRSLVT